MPRIKKKQKKLINPKKIKNRRKHVETMFLTQNQKKYTYYFHPNFKHNLNSRFYSPARYLFFLRSLENTFIEIPTLKAVARITK